MKKITISGKHNIDKINNTKSAIRECMINNINVINDRDFLYEDEIKMINKLYLEEHFVNELLVSRELNKKIASYKSQDIKKNIYDQDLLIKKEEVIEKLVASQLKCYYCSCKVKIIFIISREPKQWTLDRIDNDKCHSKENTVIACLKCNLDRRVTDIDKFKFTKQLNIMKTN